MLERYHNVAKGKYCTRVHGVLHYISTTFQNNRDLSDATTDLTILKPNSQPTIEFQSQIPETKAKEEDMPQEIKEVVYITS